MFTLPARSIRVLSRHWNDRLSHYRRHHNDEHREALIVEALRFGGLVLENDLTHSAYWSRVSLARRAALLLYLVDRGAVLRVPREGRIVYEAAPHAEEWVVSHRNLIPYLDPVLELLAALRSSQARRAQSER